LDFYFFDIFLFIIIIDSVQARKFWQSNKGREKNENEEILN